MGMLLRRHYASKEAVKQTASEEVKPVKEEVKPVKTETKEPPKKATKKSK